MASVPVAVRRADILHNYFPSHVCISDPAEASARTRDRGDEVTQDMAAQLEQEMLAAEASDPPNCR